jgi:hypothetical protein
MRLIFDCDGVLVDSEVIAIASATGNSGKLGAGLCVGGPSSSASSACITGTSTSRIAADAQAAGLALPDDFRTALHANQLEAVRSRAEGY